jgi:hypothetical protein
MSEMAVRAVDNNHIALSIQALDETQHIMRNFLEASRSIGHREQDPQTKKLGISDKVSYTLFYLFQRLEWINNSAVEKRLEAVCSKVVTTFGKLAVDAAKYDISLAAYPIAFLGKCAKAAQEKHIPEVGVKATITLLEVAKSLLSDLDVTYLELKDTFITLVTNMHELANEAFREDKNINIAFLKQPFQELKEMFSSEKLANHLDTPAILAAIQGVLAEFEALEMVMKTIPPFPEPSQEGSIPEA